ncbi:MAG: tetratricopeptide repeat protein [Pseudomonadota bacterium]
MQAFQDYRFDEARAFIEAALARDAHPQFQVIAGLLASTRMDYAAATALAELARARDPEEPGVEVVLGHILIARAEYDAARALLEAAEQELRPELDRYVPTQQAAGYHWTIYKMARLGLAWCDANQARHEAALAHYDIVLRYQNDDRFGLLGRANSLMGLGRLDEAQRVTEQLIALDPTNRYALTSQALLAYNMGNDALAEQSYKAALLDDTARYTCPHVGLGLLYMRGGLTQEAGEHFQRAIEADPNTDHTKYNELARIYMAEGRLAEAEALLQKSLEILPQQSNEAHGLMEQVRSQRQEVGGSPPSR